LFNFSSFLDKVTKIFDDTLG